MASARDGGPKYDIEFSDGAAPAVPDMATQGEVPELSPHFAESEVRYIRAALPRRVIPMLVIIGIALIAWLMSLPAQSTQVMFGSDSMRRSTSA